MAGKLIVDTIDTDNAFITLNVQQSLIATMNVSGIFSNTGVKMIGANGTVSNTAITGLVTASQIANVANTQLTGTITGSQISSNTLSNTVFQTGSVENYMSAAGLGFGMRNRIINGAMVIDQRNAGASVTPINNQYTLDRWYGVLSQASKYTVQQSTTAPAGFINSLKVTSSSAYSIGAGDYFAIYQAIEGLNVADLAWGTASAKPVTLSFQVYSSLTGTFGGVITNSATDRSYPYTYTISSANTWTSISVTIAGDTSGTWLTTNGVGLRVSFGLGVGSTYSGTAGAWAGALYISATGATSVVGTNGATFYITGVQLEKGSTATSFDYRPFGTELSLCQRYFSTTYNTGVAVGAVSNFGGIIHVMDATMSYGGLCWNLPTKMRATPTTVSYSPDSGASGKFFTNSGAGDISSNTGSPVYVGMGAIAYNVANVSVTQNSFIVAHFTADAEL